MSGSDNNKGIIPRSFSYLFESLKASSTRKKESSYHVYVSFIQIYLETIQDLLNPEAKDIRIREDPESGVFLEGVEWIKVETPNDCESIYQYGQKNRVTQSTKMNMFSSRSHAIFMFKVEKTIDDDTQISNNNVEKSITRSMLYLVDLAGSERVKKSKAENLRLKETQKINYSLLVLGNCIQSLTDKRSIHISYRDSKLTRLLQDSLGGNAKTMMIVTISPSSYNTDETISSLNFANKAMKVQNKPMINKSIDYRALANKLQNDLDRLNDQYTHLKLAYDEIDEENSKLKNGELYVEMQKKSLMNSLNNSMRKNSSSDIVLTDPNNYEYEIKKLESFYVNMLKKKSEECQHILLEIDQILFEKENEIERLKQENDQLKNKFDNQNEIVIELQRQNEDLIKSVSDLNSKVEDYQSGNKIVNNDQIDSLEKKIASLEKINDDLTKTNQDIVMSFISKTEKKIDELTKEKTKLQNDKNNMTIQLSKNELRIRLHNEEIKSTNNKERILSLEKKNEELKQENDIMYVKKNELQSQIQNIDDDIDVYTELTKKYHYINENEIPFDNQKTYYVCENMFLSSIREILERQLQNSNDSKISMFKKLSIERNELHYNINKSNVLSEDVNKEKIYSNEKLITELQSEVNRKDEIIAQLSKEKENYLQENKELLSKTSKNEKTINMINKKISHFFVNYDKIDKTISSMNSSILSSYQKEKSSLSAMIDEIKSNNISVDVSSIQSSSQKVLMKFIGQLLNKIIEVSNDYSNGVSIIEKLSSRIKTIKTSQIKLLQSTLSLLSKYDVTQLQKNQSKVFALSLSSPLETIISTSNEISSELIQKYIKNITDDKEFQAMSTSASIDTSISVQKYKSQIKLKDETVSSLKMKLTENEEEIFTLKNKINEYENNIKILKIDLDSHVSNFEVSSKLNFIFGYIILLVILTIIIYSSS